VVLCFSDVVYRNSSIVFFSVVFVLLCDEDGWSYLSWAIVVLFRMMLLFMCRGIWLNKESASAL
jgi:hypothetical protein